MLFLYHAGPSVCAIKVRLVLNEKRLPWEGKILDLRSGDQFRPEYLKLNPNAVVPTLVHDGRTIIESTIIIEYLDEVYPRPRLLPVAPLDRAYVRAFSQIIACEIHPLNNLRTRKYVSKTYRLDEEGVNTWYRHWIADGFQMLESFLAQERKHGKYCFRDQVTIADCCLVPQVFNAILYKCDLKPYPAVMRIHEACMKLDAFIAAQPSKQPDAA